ncbi:recombinase family protein [Brevundimonas sp.]|jgi:DNA invertase Pin-like site-specific DNA recombinase|uniref:recombinase family protein n=1 Tax=Brevundimonas sp. TaxID=1871086 RepID=UPI0037BED384
MTEKIMTRAAQYVRMSTERQDSSILQQKAAIATYAALNGYEIVRTYADEGVSGLLIDQRTGLKAMLADVISGSPGFEAILVYDVSRWGRFQNPDQAAHYEFLCVEAGVAVKYCAEQFENDGSFTATLLKNLKRMMAAEYSRELSAKVAQAKDQLGAAGFWQGGPPGYGLRRRHLLADGTLGRVMESGERKGPQNGRTTLVLGPADEVAVIRSIFRMFVDEKLGINTIARRLTQSGHCREGRRPWNAHYVHHILTSPRYAGTNVVRKSRRRMRATNPEYLPRSEWVCVPGAFEALVDQRTFDAAQARLHRNRTPLTDRQMLDGLARVLKRHGTLNAKLINSAREIPNAHRFVRRFGSINNAYQLVGYEPTLRQTASSRSLQEHRKVKSAQHTVDGLGAEGVISLLRRLLAEHGRLSMSLINAELGRAAYQLLATRFGGGRRLYALAGYRPGKLQNSKFNRSWDETLTSEEAEALRLRVVGGEAVPISWWERARAPAGASALERD